MQDNEFAGLDPATLAVRDMIADARELTGRMARRMRMNSTDMAAIGTLLQLGPMGATELARHLGIRSASATLMIDRMERNGLVERRRDSADRRRVTIVETAAAREASVAAWLPVVRRIDDVCKALPESERAVVLRFLSRMADVVAQER